MDVFVINLADADNIKPELLENFKHKDFINKEKQKEHCFSYLMLDRILREVYGIENREIEFLNRKPYLKSRDKYLSLSHSGEYVVIAISENECGVDIEKIKDRDFRAISARMKFSCLTLEDFYREWTKYEAEYKLGDNCKSIKYTLVDDYVIAAVSLCIQETFNIYIQNGETFPNL